MYPYAQSLGRYWFSRCYAIYDYTESSFDPAPPWQLRPNPYHHAFLSLVFSLMFSSGVRLSVRVSTRSILGSKTLCHLSLHCFFVRPGISAEIATQSMPTCVCTASFSLMSSTAFHLPARAFVGSMLRAKVPCHLLRYCVIVRPENRAQNDPKNKLYEDGKGRKDYYDELTN
jgi:hypothetical protein